ncbi:histidine kinase CKI1-like [Humulus lupulus]|uniref:histidine kinase CKI1-like n=1 Tax=Humulus lupulus TaxID=3486 RepID=UPI002B406D77|nr:histidine kinase CKI1-like [Humulus lupulus]
MTPHLSQISYIGLEAQLIFSYGKDKLNQAFALLSNSSFDNNSSTNAWYKQSVDRSTGKLLGDVVKFNPFIATNSSWFRELSLNSMNDSYAFLGTKWDNGQDLLLLKSSTINQGNKGLIILGFLVKELIDVYYSEVNLVGGSLYLATKDDQVLVNDGIKGTQVNFDVAVDNDNNTSTISVSFELVKPNGPVGNVTCHPYNETSTKKATVVNIQGAKYNFYCSSLDLIGVQSVYALALPQSGLIEFIDKHIMEQLILLISIMVTAIVPIFYFVFKNFRDSIIENYLRATLIKQMEATKQAQKKNEDQNLVFARASHDIRAPLAGISALIDLSYKEVAPGSELETNLRQMDACTDDLIGILNTFLDTRKIEAGKMQLEEDEFEMAQLLEEVVDFYHPFGAKREVDLILDPCDASVIKFSRVKGDRIKLKQILRNLLSNAIKCTPEHGHVVLRAWAKKPSLTSSTITSSNRKSIIQLLPCLFYKNKTHKEDSDQAMDTAMNDPHVMDFVFEVDDTGKGIPKEKQKDLFENYVQDKETSILKEGTGLGLGIVKSLVQLMRGEIGIVDKDIGEKGACFRFNVLLSVCEDAFNSNNSTTKEKHDEMDSNELISNDIRTPNFSPTLNILTQSPKVDRSYVILMIQSHERRRVSQKFMKRLGIKVFAVEQWEQLPSILKKVRFIKYGNNNSDSSNNSSTSQSPYLGVEATNKDAATLSNTVVDGTNYILSLFKRSTTNHHYQRKTGGLAVMVMDATAGPISQLSKMVSEFKNSLRNISSCKVVWLVNPLSHTSYNFLFQQDDIIMHKPFHGARLYQVVGLLPEFGGSSSSPTKQLRKVSTKDRSSCNAEFEIQEVGSTSKVIPSCFRSKTQFQELTSSLKHGDSMTLPFDFILMDCEMSIMDGYEATREIRKVEKSYGVHIPIIGLTAHSPGSEEANQTIQAGMDACLSKPLKHDNLLDAIRYIK